MPEPITTAAELDTLPVQPVNLAVAKAIYNEGAFCGECDYEDWDSCAACRRWCLTYASAALAAMPDQQPTALVPAERIALTVAKAQVARGDEVTPNIAAVCVMALARIEADHG